MSTLVIAILLLIGLVVGWFLSYCFLGNEIKKVPAKDRYLINQIKCWEVKIIMNGSHIGLDIGTHRTEFIEDVGDLDVPLIFWVTPTDARKFSAKLSKAADIIETPEIDQTK